MTTTIKLHVNGRYKALVKQDELPWVEVHGNYEGSPNPSGGHSFNLRHNTSNKFVVNEEQVPYPEAETQQIGSEDVGDASSTLGLTLEAGKATGENNSTE